jgi:hypothetical protein
VFDGSASRLQPGVDLNHFFARDSRARPARLVKCFDGTRQRVHEPPKNINFK